MTFAALAASLVRPTGNLYFVVAFCFVFAAARQAHLPLRDLRHDLRRDARRPMRLYRHRSACPIRRTNTPASRSFYDAYINSSAFGIVLDPSIGPATAKLLTSLRAGSKKIRSVSAVSGLDSTASEFPQRSSTHQFRPFNAAQLTALGSTTHPQYDYFELMCLLRARRPGLLRFRHRNLEAIPALSGRYTLRNWCCWPPGWALDTRGSGWTMDGMTYSASCSCRCKATSCKLTASHRGRWTSSNMIRSATQSGRSASDCGRYGFHPDRRPVRHCSQSSPSSARFMRSATSGSAFGFRRSRRCTTPPSFAPSSIRSRGITSSSCRSR